MATTEGALLARVVALLAALDYSQARALDFSLEPSAAIDKAFIVRYVGTSPTGGMRLTEEARGTLQIQIARQILGGNYDAAQQTLAGDGRTILNAIVRDGADTSGEYAVEDAGRAFTVDAPKGASYLIGRLNVSVNFEAQF